MGLSFLPLWLDLSLAFLVGVAVWWLIVGLIFWWKNRGFVYARGANGMAGDQATLSCPSGTVIKAERVFLSCADLDSTGKSPLCDPFLNDGTVNPSNTQLITSQVEQLCNGQNSCSFTIPAPVSTLCPGSGGSSCSTFQMVGTYTCQA
jgi:hypothetical protein